LIKVRDESETLGNKVGNFGNNRNGERAKKSRRVFKNSQAKEPMQMVNNGKKLAGPRRAPPYQITMEIGLVSNPEIRGGKISNMRQGPRNHT